MAIANGQATLIRFLAARGIWTNIKSVCELGSQEPRPDELQGLFEAFGMKPLVENYSARDFYRHLGISQYTSVDFNGEHNALPYDLNRNLRADYNFHGIFVLVTNFGASEHCFNQYEVFRNIHQLCAAGGYMLHTVPTQGWGRHCFFRYDANFFEDLAAANNYQVLYLEPFLRLKAFLKKDKAQTIGHIQAVCAMAEFAIDQSRLSGNSTDPTAQPDISAAVNQLGKGDALFNITMACAMKKNAEQEFITPIQGLYRK